MQDVLNETPSHAYFQYTTACKNYRWISLVPGSGQVPGPQASLTFTGMRCLGKPERCVVVSGGHVSLGTYITIYTLLSSQGGPYQVSIDGTSYNQLGSNYSPNPLDSPLGDVCAVISSTVDSLGSGEHKVTVGGTGNYTSYFTYFQ